MNLHARIGAEDLGLWQTPTYITWMCMMTPVGVGNMFRGKKATRSLLCYIEWVRQRRYSYDNDDKPSILKVDEHIDKIRAILYDPKLRVYWM